MDISAYRTLVFDCDGVVLDSNNVKTQAFYQAALPYGETAAQALVDYHQRHGGISRYQKFALFLEQIVTPGATGPSLESLLSAYGQQVRQGLMHCPIAAELETLRHNTAESRWMIVSGGDQQEIRQVFQARGIAGWFDGGIFGSPDSKDEILERESRSGNLTGPALFLGDSRYDHQAAAAAGLDFTFVSQWTEFTEWGEYCAEHSITSVPRLSDLNRCK